MHIRANLAKAPKCGPTESNCMHCKWQRTRGNEEVGRGGWRGIERLVAGEDGVEMSSTLENTVKAGCG